jgi:hypothetical protein
VPDSKRSRHRQRPSPGPHEDGVGDLVVVDVVDLESARTIQICAKDKLEPRDGRSRGGFTIVSVMPVSADKALEFISATAQFFNASG